MIFLDTFSAEHREMIRTIEVLDPLIMSFAKKTLDTILIFKIQLSKNVVSLYYLVQNIEIKWQSISWINLFYKFPTNRASDSLVMVQVL